MEQIKELYQHFLRCNKVSTDSRLDVKDSIFFALSGDNFNGNAFAKPALNQGAILAVIDDDSYNTGEGFFLVDNVLDTIQQLAAYHRNQFSAPLLSITGSNGKTTTKELIAVVLSTTYNTSFTKGNLNNHIGVPLSLLELNSLTDIAIIEMGANHVGEIKELCHIAEPDLGIITNIGKAHIEGFGSFEGVIQAKGEMYDFIRANKGEVFVNADDALLMNLSQGIKQFTYGTPNDADLTAKLLSATPFVKIAWYYNEQEYICSSQLYGKYNFYNILAAIACGLNFHIVPEKINEAIEGYKPTNNRSQQITTKNNEIILDAYNANPVSMEEAILSFDEYNPDNPWIILGDMFELGHLTSEEHKRIIDLLVNLPFKKVILIGDEFNRFNGIHPFYSFKDTEETINHLKRNPINMSNVLIKGSRGMALESLLPYL